MADFAHIQRVEEIVSAQLGRAMGHAFLPRVGFRYLTPDEERREAALAWLFGVFLLGITQQNGEVYATPERSGGAFWIRPGAELAYRDAFRAGLLAMPHRMGWRGFWRSLRMEKAVERARRRALPAPHWYLLALGVDPQAQGKGIGSALVQPVLQRADTEGQPCYLETFTEENLGYYRRFGFEVSVREKFADLPFWGMTRAPKG